MNGSIHVCLGHPYEIPAFRQLGQVFTPPMGPSSMVQLLTHRLNPWEKMQEARMDKAIWNRFELERTTNGSLAARGLTATDSSRERGCPIQDPAISPLGEETQANMAK